MEERVDEAKDRLHSTPQKLRRGNLLSARNWPLSNQNSNANGRDSTQRTRILDTEDVPCRVFRTFRSVPPGTFRAGRIQDTGLFSSITPCSSLFALCLEGIKRIRIQKRKRQFTEKKSRHTRRRQGTLGEGGKSPQVSRRPTSHCVRME